MAGVPTLLWLPCEVFEVSVALDDNDGPTALERAALAYVLAQRGSDLPGLASFLGLGQRVTLELIGFLWQRGYLEVDPSTSYVRVSAEARESVSGRNWKALMPGRQALGGLTVMRELVSGQVAIDRSTSATPASDRAVPPLVTSTILEGCTAQELSWAVSRDPQLPTAFRKSARFLSVRLDRTGPEGIIGRRQWLRFDCRASLSGNLTELTPMPANDPLLTVWGTKIARVLTSWVAAEGHHLLAQNLVKMAEPTKMTGHRSLAARAQVIVDDLERLDQTHDGAGNDRLAQWHSKLNEIVLEHQRDMSQVSDIELVSMTTNISSLLRKVWHQADRQLIVLAPVIDYKGADRLDKRVKDKIFGDQVAARIHLLWGTDNMRVLPRQAFNRLSVVSSDTQSSYGRRFWFTERPSRIGTPMLVADGRHLVYLSQPDLAEVEAPGDLRFALRVEFEVGSPALSDLVEHVRDRISDGDMLGDLTPVPRTHNFSRDDMALTRVLAVPEGAAEASDRAETSAIEQSARSSELKALAQRVANRIVGADRAAAVLSDTEVFRKALDILADIDPISREDAVVISIGIAGRPSTGALAHEAIVAAIEARAGAGLRTVLLVGYDKEEEWPDLGSIGAVAARFGEHVRVEFVPGQRTSFLCGARQLVVAPSHLTMPPLEGRGRNSDLILGVLAVERAVCTEFLRILVAHWPMLGEEVSGMRTRVASGVGTAPEVLALSDIVSGWRRIGREHRDDAVRRQAYLYGTLRQQDDGLNLPLLEALIALATPDHFPRLEDASEVQRLRRDLLTCAARWAPAGPSGDARATLLAEAWRDGQWQAAAVLAAELADTGRIGREFAGLCEAAADIELGIHIEDSSWALGLAADDRIASIALFAEAVLFNGDAEAGLAVQLVDAGTMPAWAQPLCEIADVIVKFWQETGDAWDEQALRDYDRLKEALVERAGAALAFREVFGRSSRTNFRNRNVTRVANALFQQIAGFHEVAELIPEHNVETLSAAAWQAVLDGLRKALGSNEVDIEATMDSMIDDAHQAVTNAEPVVGRYRAGIQNDLRAVILRAIALRDVLAGIKVGQMMKADTSLDAIVAVLRRAGRELPTLLAKLEPRSHAGPVVERLMQRLNRLLEQKSP